MMGAEMIRKIVAILCVLNFIVAISACSSSDVKEDTSSAGSDEIEEFASGEEEGVNPDLAEEELSPEMESAPATQEEPQEDLAFADTPPEEKSEQVPVEEPPLAEPAASAANAQTSSFQGSAREVNITDLKYLAKRGNGTLLVQTSGPATYRTREVPNLNQVIIEIANARLPNHLKRPLITKDFKQNIASVNAYQDPGSSTARIVVQMRSPASPSIQQEGGALYVDAGGGGVIEAPIVGAEESAPSMRIAQADVAAAESDEDSAPEPVEAGQGSKGLSAMSSSLEQLNNTSLRFYGKPISIEVRDTNVRDVLSLIAEQSGANLVVSDKVDGNITLKLRQVPWDQALLLVMKSKQLGYVRQGSVLRIAPLQALQAETEDAKKVQDAQRAAEPLKVKVIPVSYAKVTDLQTQAQSFLSPRGKVVADTRTSAIVLSDIAEVIDRVTNLIRALDTPPLQVSIEGKVVEAREEFSRNFGIDWNFQGDTTNLGGKTNLTQNFGIRPGADQVGTNGFGTNINIGVLDFLGSIDARLQLFEKEDVVKVVSSPQITTLNNEPASILQQSTTYIQQSNQTAAGTQIIPVPVPIRLSLDVTPQITADSDVIMQVTLRREFNASAQGSQPNVNNREAKTKVLVRNGQTAVIGGIYSADNTQSEQGVPFMRTLPVVGWLFKNRVRAESKNELLLFLTPRILNAEKVPKEETL